MVEAARCGDGERIDDAFEVTEWPVMPKLETFGPKPGCAADAALIPVNLWFALPQQFVRGLLEPKVPHSSRGQAVR